MFPHPLSTVRTTPTTSCDFVSCDPFTSCCVSIGVYANFFENGWFMSICMINDTCTLTCSYSFDRKISFPTTWVSYCGWVTATTRWCPYCWVGNNYNNINFHIKDVLLQQCIGFLKTQLLQQSVGSIWMMGCCNKSSVSFWVLSCCNNPFVTLSTTCCSDSTLVWCAVVRCWDNTWIFCEVVWCWKNALVFWRVVCCFNRILLFFIKAVWLRFPVMMLCRWKIELVSLIMSC